LSDKQLEKIIQLAAESHKKRLTARFIPPVMTIVTALYFVTYFRFNLPSILTLLFGVFCVIANVYLTSKERIINLGKIKINSRSDGADLARWIFNICCFDVVIFTVFQPSLTALMALWMMVIFAAQADTFKRKYQSTILVIAVLTATAMMYFMHPDVPLSERILVYAIFVSLTVLSNNSERTWINEIIARHRAQNLEFEAITRERDMSELADKLKFDAMLGENLKFFSHEINNLIFILEVHQERKGPDDVVLKTIKKMKGIAHLVLSNIDGRVKTESQQFTSLASDVQQILLKRISLEKVEVSFIFDSNLNNECFWERKGSTFYILNNLVNNAVKSMANRTGRKLEVEFQRNHALVSISVRDNGVGIPKHQISNILAGTAKTSRDDGHGIGMKFVLSECEKNGFTLNVESVVDEGTVITLLIDLELNRSRFQSTTKVA
jgi:signal transduction histidine kinase